MRKFVASEALLAAVKILLSVVSEAASITEGPVFRRMRRVGVVLEDALRPQGIAEVVNLYAEKAGYNPADFSGHSLRTGEAAFANVWDSPADAGYDQL